MAALGRALALAAAQETGATCNYHTWYRKELLLSLGSNLLGSLREAMVQVQV